LKGADVLGNAGQTTRVFKKDTAGPTVAITAPSAGSKHGTPPTLAATVDDSLSGNSNVSAAYYKVVQGAYDSGWQTASLSGSGATRTVSQAISNDIWSSLQDNDITVYIQGVDEANNTGEANRILKVDATAPAVTITAPVAYSHHKTVPTIEATIDDTGKGDSDVTSAGYRITRTGYDSDWQSLTLSGSGKTRTVSQAISDTIWNALVADGDFVLHVRGTDEVSNTRESEYTLWKDTTPPNATINSPSADTPFKTAPTFTATIIDPSPGSSKIVKYYYKVDSGSWTSVDIDAASQSVTVSISRSISDIWDSIGQGNFTLYVRGEDVVGNVADVPHASIAERVFKKDTTAPTVGSLQLSLNSPLTQGHGAVHLTATVNDVGGSGIQKAQYAVKTNSVWGSWVDMTGSGAPPVSVSADIDISSWPPGRYEVKVRGIDNAGNEGTESSPVKIDVPVISGITASSISDTSMAVSWLTDIEAIDLSQTTNGIVRYDTVSLTVGSPTASEIRTPGDDTHRVVITGLTAGATYNYQVTSGATVSATGQFTVPLSVGTSYIIKGYAKSGGTGVANAIVYVTVNHSGTEKTVSTLSRSDPPGPLGYWEVDIQSIAYSTGDNVKIRATMNSGGARIQNTTISGTSPQDVGDINLSTAGPAISDISATLNPGAISYTLTATVDDASASNATVQSAQYKIDSGSWVSMTPADGAASSVSEVFTAFIKVSDLGSSGSHTIYIKGTDDEGFTTQSGSYGSASVTVYPATNNLVSGLNLVSLQRAPIGNTLTSYNVIPTIANNTAMYKLNRSLQQWQNAFDDGGVVIGEDFNLVTGDGYFIQVNDAATWTYNGAQITSAPSPLTTLQKGGINIIGVPYNVAGGLTAYDLINGAVGKKIEDCTSVSKWEGQLWVTYPGTDFPIEVGKGYVVTLSGTGTVAWTPPFGTAIPAPSRFYRDMPAQPKPRIVAESAKITTIPNIIRIRSTNPSSASATISWMTDVPSSGEVHYGTSASLGMIAYGDSGIVHWIQLANLQPDTTYYYKVVSSTAGGSVVDDNNGKLYTFKTGSVLMPTMPNLISGKVELEGKPVDAIIYAMVEHDNIVSAPISAASENGSWLLNLGNLRSKTGKAFPVKPGDIIRIEADGGISGSVKTEVAVSESSMFDVGVLKLSPNPLTEASLKLLPRNTVLLQNYPNPFNPDTWIPYELSKTADVVIRIYNVNGHLVKTLELGKKETGYYVAKEKAAYWDGRNDSGELVSSGVYFYQMKASNFVATGKMVILK
jgi:flagellar hook assembly protein FlgD